MKTRQKPKIIEDNPGHTSHSLGAGILESQNTLQYKKLIALLQNMEKNTKHSKITKALHKKILINFRQIITFM